MKIKGFFRADNNAPYVAATLVQDEFQLGKDVWFLVDSGASATIIADKDALSLGIDYSKLQRLQEGMTGIGGTVETFVLPSVKLVFSTEDGSYEEDMEQIYVLRHPITSSIQKARVERIPSLLGRDFLNKYAILMKHSDDVVLITDEDVMAA
jgi:hypothetical protein